LALRSTVVPLPESIITLASVPTDLLQNLYSCSAPKEQGLPIALALSADYLGRKGAWRVHGGGFAGTVQAYVPRKLMPGYVRLMERYFGPGSVIPVSVRAKGATRVRI